jgi:hypothetical protein
LALLGVAGCQPAPTPPPVRQSDKLAIKPLIKFYEKAKLGESIDDVSRGLAKCVVYVPTEELHERGKPMKMKTSPDNRGREWLYLYTDEPELLAAFPQGTPYVKMRFGSVFLLIAEDPRFWGLFINRTPEYHYLIPREVFGDVRKVLDSDPSWEKIPLK